MTKCPRIMIAATGSGAGKTTITCGLLGALVERGLRPTAFKCGPDYIDPMFHRSVMDIQGGNLDLFLSTRAQVNEALRAHGDLSVLEGVMGYYDGLGGTDTQASSYHVAQETKTPVILTVDARAASLSIAAVVRGFIEFRPNSNIQGVLLNRCTGALCRALAPVIAAECGVPVLGYLPNDARWSLESRHLGLVTAREVHALRARLVALAAEMRETVNIDEIIALAMTAPDLPDAPCPHVIQKGDPVRLAVADDEAFCFRYEENLACLQAHGVECVPFSPMRDAQLPPDIDGLYLCGGYPELHLPELSGNAAMRRSIARAVQGGLPTWAECGGFMYLMERFVDKDGAYPLVGTIEGACFKTDRLVRFGYAILTATCDTLMMDAGDQLPVHSFHYSDTTHPGDACIAEKPTSGRRYPCAHGSRSLFALYPHLYLPGAPKAAQKLVHAMRQYKRGRNP